MQKHLQKLLLIAAMLFVPWVTQAQTPITTFPYTCGFESSTDSASWVTVNGSQENGWYIGTAVNTTPSGSHALYVSNNSGVSNTYDVNSDDASYSWAYQRFTFAAGSYDISFQWKCLGELDSDPYDFFRVFIVPDAVTLTAGTLPSTTYTWSNQFMSDVPSGWIGINGTESYFCDQNTFTTLTTNFTITTPGTYKLVFLWLNDNNTCYNPPAAIDDISITANTCPPPANLLAISATTTSIAFSWTNIAGASQWIVEYDTVNFVPGTGAGTTVTIYDTSSTIIDSLTGLDTGKYYYIYVHADCGAGDTSTNVFLLATTLSGNGGLPYMCGFEGPGDNDWDIINGSQANKWYVGTATHFTGSKSLYISDNNGTSNSYSGSESYVFAVKEFVLSQPGEYAYSYNWKCNGESSYDFLRAALVPENTVLTAGSYCGFNNTSGMPTGGKALDGGYRLNLQTSWQTQSGTFLITTPGTYKWVFMWRNDGSVYNQPPVAIDNVFLQLNSCPAPTVAATCPSPDSIILTWHPNGSETSWLLTSDSMQLVVNDTTYTFSGLQGNTEYHFSVRAICGAGDTSLPASLTQRTPCSFLNVLPFIYGFEDATAGSSTTGSAFVNCWTRLNNGTSSGGYPYVANSTSYNHTSGGTKGLYWYNATTTGTYGDYQVVVLPGVNTNTFNISSLQLSFWAKASSTSYHPTFLIGVMTDPNDINTFTQVATVNVNPGSSTAWAKYTADLSDYTGTGNYVAIRANRASSSWYAYVDDISLEQTPDCPAVSNFVSTSPTTSSIDVSWTENGTATSWTIEYGEHGFTYGSGISEIVTSLPYTIYSLSSNTEYDIYVTPDCYGVGATEMFAFRTECDPMDSLPYNMGFEASEGVSTGSSTSSTFVNCWHLLNNGSDYFGYPYVSSSSTYNHTPGGSRGLYWYNTTTTGTYGDYQCVILPAVSTDYYDVSDLRVTFWAKSSSTSYYPVFLVGVMTDPSDINSFTQVGTVNVGNSTAWDKYTVNLSSYHGSGTYVAIRANRPSSSWYAYVDDISLHVAPDCPEVSHIIASLPTDTSVYLNWTENGNATSWTIEYGLHGFTPGSGITQTVTSRPYLVTGLSANTEYDVYVTPSCSGTTVTEMSSFRTECPLLETLPLFMGFESSEGVSTGSSSSTTFVNCWHRLNNGTTYFGYPYVSSSSAYNHTPGGSRGLYWYATTTTGTYGDYQIVVLPGVAANVNSLQLKFWARATSTSYHPVFLVGVMTDPNDVTTFQQVGQPINVEGTDYQEFITSLGTYTGSGKYVAIRANRPTSSWYATTDDITLEPLPSCPAIENLEVAAATPGSALLTWSYMAGTDETPSNFQIIFDSVGGTSPDTIYSTDPFYSFVNLMPGTYYTAHIRAHCNGTSYGAWDSITFSTAVLRCIEVDTTTADTVIFSNSTSGTSGCIAYSAYGNTAYQTIYTASELTAAGLTPGSITGIDLGFTPSSSYNKEFTIFLGNTSTTSITDATLEDPNRHIQVYGPASHPMGTTGWQHYEFDVPFTWDGVSSIIMTTFMNQPTGSSHSSSSGLTGYYVSASNKARYRYKDSSPFTLSDYNSGYSSSTYSYRAAIHFYTGECQTMASCANPEIRVVNVDTATIDVAWTPGYQETIWDLDYRIAGSSNWTSLATNLTTTFYSVTGLTPGTVYDFRVSHTCDTTFYYGTTTAHTECVAMPIPFTVGFESSEGWTSGTNGTVPSPCWTKYTNYSTSYYPYVNTTAHTGSQAMYMYLYTYSSYCYFTLPKVEVPLDSLMVSFWAYKSSSSYPNNKFQVGVMTDPNDYNTFTPLGEFVPEYNGSWVQYDVMLNNYTGPDGHIAFVVPVQSASDAYYSYTYIDDIVVDYIPSCPHVTDVHTLSAHGDTLTLGWTPVGTESEWEVSFNGNTYLTNDDTIQLTGVRTNRYYEFSVRAVCSSDDTSTAVTYQTINCGILDSLPYTQDFEHVRPGSYTSFDFAPCWHLNTDATTYPYVYVNYSSSYNHTPGGNRGVYWYRTTSTGSYGTYQMLVLPEVDTTLYPANNLMLTFWAKPSSLGYEPIFYVGVMDNPNVESSFFFYDTIRLNSSSTDWTKYTVRFDQLPDSIRGSYVAIRCNFPSSYWYAYLDDITLNAIPDCEQVEDIVVATGPTSATVTWTSADPGYEGATLEYRESGSSSSWTTVTVVSVNYASITGLTPGTEYELKVYASCNAGPALEVSTTFNTPLFDCHEYDSTNLINVTVGSTSSTSSSNYLPSYSFYNYGYTQQFYTAHEIGASGQITRISVYPTAVAQQRTYQIYMGYSSDSSAASFILPSHMTLVYNDGHIPIEANQWLDFPLTVPFNYNVDSGNLVVIFRDLTGSYVSGNAFLTNSAWSDAARYAYRDSDPYTPGAFSDGYTLSERNVMKFFGGVCLDASTCAAPPTVVTDITPTTVDIAWTPGNTESSWNLYYRLRGEANFNVAAMGVTATTYQFTGLLGGSHYEFMVVPVCTDSLSSIVNATTECAAITMLPFFEDFNSWGTGTGRIPNCWFRTGTYSSYTYITTSYNHSGSGGGSIYMYCSTGTYISYIVLPELDSTVYTANQTQLVFYAYHSSTSYGAPAFEVGVMEDPTDASTFVPVDTVYHNGEVGTWNIFEAPLANYTGTGVNVALRTLYTTNYTYPYLDDFTLELIPTCPRPDSLEAGNATTTSVDLNWHERGDANQWIVEYGPVGFTPGTGTTVSANSNPFTLTGMTPGYQGEYYVRSICSGNDTGEYSRVPCAFNTAQIPATIPYYCNFEDTTEWNNWQTSTNTGINWYRGTAVADSGSYSMYVSANNGATYRPYSYSSVVNTAAYRDVDFGTIDSSFTLTFRARVGGTTSNTYDGLMVFLVDPSIPTTATSTAITSPWGNVNNLYRIAHARLDTNWNTYTASFDTVSGLHRVAFFWFNQNTQASYPNLGEPAAVDNIHIDYSSCVRPVLLTANTNTETARLSWQGSPTGNYEIRYRPYPNGTTNTIVYSNTNWVTITGLTPLTQYAFWVRKICGAGDTSLFSDGETFTTEMCENGSHITNYTSSMSSTTSSYSPIGYGFYNYSYVQTIIDSAYMAGIDGDITAFSFVPATTTAGTYFTNMTVYMANVPESDLSSGFILPDTTNHRFVTMVTNADFTFTSTDEQIHGFDTTFTWDGHSNVLFAVNRQHGSYLSGASFQAHTHTGTGYKMRYIYQDSGPYSITSPGSGYTSNEVGDITLYACSANACGDPIITSITKDYHSATITWMGDGNDYEVNIKESTAPDWPATDIAVTGTSYTFNGLMPSTNYTFRVRQNCSIDSNGYSEWVIDGFLTDSLPCFPPDSLHTTAVTNATATFDWNVNGNETAWDIHVWYGSFDSTYRVITRPVTVSGFIAGLTYNASIRALCGTDLLEGDWGDTVQFSTATCPDVTGLATSNVTTNSVTLNWNANPMAQSYMIEYGYAGFTQGSGTQAISSTNSYVATGLLDGVTFDFYVKAVCGDDWSSENWAGVSATTQEGTIPCDAPTGVNTAVADNSVTVNWTAGTGNISFEIEYGPHGFSHGAGVTTNATSSPAVINNLEYETQYDLYVRAICEQNTYSPWSTMATFTTGERPSEDCDPVQNLNVDNVTDHNAEISWQPGPTGDRWQVVLTDDNGATVSDNVTTETHATLNGLDICKNYSVKVRTVCGDDNYSAYVTANFRTEGDCEGIEDVDGISCRIFPNPATSSTTISVSGVNGKVRIAVVDMNGRTVATETLECSADCEKTMEVDKLAQGAYFVRITADNTNMVRKLIVR